MNHYIKRNLNKDKKVKIFLIILIIFQLFYIAEKKVISENAIIGAYFFSNGYLFLRTCEKLLKSNVLRKHKEYYISCLYNLLLEENNKIVAFPSIGYNSFGTPSELKKYISLT